MTGLNSATADMIYESIEVKEANLNFWGFVFPMIFALAFGFFGFCFPAIFSVADMSTDEKMRAILGLLPFAVISIVAFIIAMRNPIINIAISLFGTTVKGTVYGYINDNVMINGLPAQKMKILIDTRNGKKFVMYQLSRTDKPYAVNSQIALRIYKNMCKIVPNSQSVLE